jgi:DNA (cytosine-5)-methyltransferase 1
MKHGSLFSGYGGLDMGVRSAIGGDTVWNVEFDAAPAAILRHHAPDVPVYGDIADVDFRKVEPVDVLTGGFPCQDVSFAGLRRGIRPGTRSGLWAQFARAIDELQPSLVVIENVRGLLSAEAHSKMESCPWCVGDGPGECDLRALGAVLGDLVELGYDARWGGFRASDVGAPHSRFRVFIVAYPHSGRRREEYREYCLPRRESEPYPIRDIASHAPRGGRAAGCVAGPQAPPAGETAGDGPGRGDSPVDWGEYGAAIGHWERILGRVAPDPALGRTLNPLFAEWMMGLPVGHVTDPAIGLSNTAQKRVCGNGVVPQQAEYAVRTLLCQTTAHAE